MNEAMFRTPEERQRFLEAKARDQDQTAKKDAARRQNEGFTQVYEKGWERIRALVQENKSAAVLYAYIAQHTDPATGAVVASQEVICEETGLSRTTLWRASNFLEEHHAMIRIRVGGSVYAYALDPSEIWKSWDSAKETAVFRTKTLVRKRDQDGNVRRRLQVMVRERAGEPELPLEDDE